MVGVTHPVDPHLQVDTPVEVVEVDTAAALPLHTVVAKAPRAPQVTLDQCRPPSGLVTQLSM